MSSPTSAVRGGRLLPEPNHSNSMMQVFSTGHVSGHLACWCYTERVNICSVLIWLDSSFSFNLSAFSLSADCFWTNPPNLTQSFSIVASLSGSMFGLKLEWTGPLPSPPPVLAACTEAHLGRGQPTSHRAYNGSLRDAKYSTEPTLSLRLPRWPLGDKQTLKLKVPASVSPHTLFTTSFLNGTHPGHVNTSTGGCKRFFYRWEGTPEVQKKNIFRLWSFNVFCKV